jgi:hypothetical protein
MGKAKETWARSFPPLAATFLGAKEAPLANLPVLYKGYGRDGAWLHQTLAIGPFLHSSILRNSLANRHSVTGSLKMCLRVFQ